MEDSLNGLVNNKKSTLPDVGSRFAIGQRVKLNFYDAGTLDRCYVRTVMFTAGKVRYSIYCYPFKENGESEECGPTTLHNIDSYFVEPSDVDERISVPFDNYS